MSTESKIREEIIAKDEGICNSCGSFLRLMLPGDDDWMDNDRIRVVCACKHKTIIESLSTGDVKNIEKIEIPTWCPRKSKSPDND